MGKAVGHVHEAHPFTIGQLGEATSSYSIQHQGPGTGRARHYARSRQVLAQPLPKSHFIGNAHPHGTKLRGNSISA
jgi:hypothetical protein